MINFIYTNRIITLQNLNRCGLQRFTNRDTETQYGVSASAPLYTIFVLHRPKDVVNQITVIIEKTKTDNSFKPIQETFTINTTQELCLSILSMLTRYNIEFYFMVHPEYW